MNNKLDFDPVTQDDPNADGKNPASMTPVMFDSNGSKLLGTMFIAGGEALHPAVLLLGGFPGNEVNFDIAHMIRRHGYNVFTFFPRGSWGSEGNYSWKNMLDDTASAVQFLKSNLVKESFKVDSTKIVSVGYSMGGFSVIYNSILLDELKNVCGIAPFNAGYFGKVLKENEMVKKYSAQQMQSAMEFVNSPRSEELLDEFILHQNDWNLLNHIEKLSQKNLLIIGAKYDSIAPVDLHHNPLKKRLELNPKFKSYILETGHSFSDKRIQLMRIISEWINQIEF